MALWPIFCPAAAGQDTLFPVKLTRMRSRGSQAYPCANDTRDAYPTVLGDVHALVVKSVSKLQHEREDER